MKKLIAITLAVVMILSMTACGKKTAPESETAMAGIEIGYVGKEKNVLAKHFEIFNLEKDIKLIATYGEDMKISDRILALPKGEKVPKNLPKDVVVVETPATNLLLASAPTMSLINSIGGVENVKMTTKTTWYIDEVKTALKDKSMIEVGNSDAPDYETIVANNPSLSVFSPMLLETSEVIDQLRKLEIKFMVDQSTNELDALGRTEWVKVYGALLGKAEEANKIFADQLAIAKDVENKLKNVAEKDKKSVVFFYVNSKGVFNVRYEDDYLSNAIKIAGGNGIYASSGAGGVSNIAVEKELFYTMAKDADVLIYNSTLGGKPKDLKAVEGRAGDIIKDFKAYKSGEIWATSPNFYQVSDTLGSLVGDLYTAFYDETASDELTYLRKLK
ncbi:MAG: ABC transporter substrate-binding protein [Clostridia bacterium]